MGSRIEVITSFALLTFLGHLAGIIIGLVIALFIVPKLLKGSYRPWLRAGLYGAFGAVGGTLDYWDQAKPSTDPLTDFALIFVIMILGTLLLVAPFIYYHWRRQRTRA